MHRVHRLNAMRLAAALSAVLGLAAASVPGRAADDVPRLLVKLRAPAAVSGAVARRDVLSSLSRTAAVPLQRIRPMSGGAEVLGLPAATTPSEARAIAQRLTRDPSVEFAEPDRRIRALLIPNDPDYALQWHLHDARSEPAAANLPDAWDISTGAASVVIAVLDTGLVAHADLDGARVYPGYDFVSDVFIANDGDGRDPDPSDPGDWTTAADANSHSGCPSEPQDSSWHGTHVAGIIAASGNNAIGITGVNWNSKLLPVRVLGKCGGYLSDLLDGARWAAGVADPTLPANPHPARVLNLSLGAEAACTPLVQSAVDDVLAAGAVIVAAAGNGGGDATGITPANCAGVIAVAALDRAGDKAYYSNSGASVALSAAGGVQYGIDDARGILSLFNIGTTVPAPSPDGDTYMFLQGTSMAAPQVAGVASLMLSVNPALTPAQVRQKLQATARPFPAGSTCNTASCGAGMLDAAVALESAANTVAPTADAGADQKVAPNAPVALSAAGSAARVPASIAQYTWTQVSGTPVTLSDVHSIGTNFTAPSGGGTLQFRLTVADDGGLTASDTVDVEVANATLSASTPAPSAGGGGDSRCFIATAAYGSADAADVMQLRRFRDRYLLTNPVGRAIVATYYRLSPPFADAIRPHPLLRKLVRIGLAPYVALARWLNVGPVRGR